MKPTLILLYIRAKELGKRLNNAVTDFERESIQESLNHIWEQIKEREGKTERQQVA